MVAFARSRIFGVDLARAQTSAPGNAVIAGNAVIERMVASADQALRCAHLVSIGDLTTQTAAADLLECAVSIAEAAPWQPLSIAWIGDGVLRGLLKAQPLPETLWQVFLGMLPDAETISEVASADFLCFTGRNSSPAAVVAAVRRSGIPVIGCAENESVAYLIRDGHVGWLFEDRHPRSIMTALARALDARAAFMHASTAGIGSVAEPRR